MGKEKKVKTCTAYSLTQWSVVSGAQDGVEIRETSGWVFLQT